MLPSLDAHAHIDPARRPDELASTGMVLAMTLSLEEAARGVARHDPHIAWGVGCHPCKLHAQEAFDAARFRELAEQTAVIGEIGLDGGSPVPLERQLNVFRQTLVALDGLPRFISIHSSRATALVLQELRRQPVNIPILHWWTGSVPETRQAVALGCCFSVHSAVARQVKFRSCVPTERLLVESDCGYGDPPAAIPCRIEWVEYLLAQQLGLRVEAVRSLAWDNFARLVQQTGTASLLPPAFLAQLISISTMIV